MSETRKEPGNNLTAVFDALESLEGEAQTARGKPYKVWVMVVDADDGEMRVVPRALVREYTRNLTYGGKWSITMRGSLEDLRRMARLAHPHEWRDGDGHYHYTDMPKRELLERGLI